LVLLLLRLFDQLVEVLDDIALNLLRRLGRILLAQAILGAFHVLRDARDQLPVLLLFLTLLVLLALFGIEIGEILLRLGLAVGLTLGVAGVQPGDGERQSEQHKSGETGHCIPPWPATAAAIFWNSSNRRS